MTKKLIIIFSSAILALLLWFFIVGPILIEKEIIPSSAPKEQQINPASVESEHNSPNSLEEQTERVVLSLNFDENNMPAGLMPMGEKITHDIESNPRGHEGIDFTWEQKVPIDAFLGGTVIAIKRSEGHPEADLWDVGVRTGKFLNSYTELEDYNHNLTVGKRIEAGEFVGFPWHPPETHEGYRMIHWNFGYWVDVGKDIFPERLCPLTYFDNVSKVLIEQIWQKTRWDHKAEYPLICNGYFEGKDE